jgi:hypothetical protein
MEKDLEQSKSMTQSDFLLFIMENIHVNMHMRTHTPTHTHT